MVLIDTHILIFMLRGEALVLRWLEAQTRQAISMSTSIEVLMGCRAGKSERIKQWLNSFSPSLRITRLPGLPFS